MNSQCEVPVSKVTGDAEHSECTRSGRCYTPAVDILETPSELVLKADMPGVPAENVEISFERGELAIHGRVQPRRAEDATYLLREYGVADFVRTFRIGEGIDSLRIAAEMKGGVLTLHLPKTEQVKARKIQVKSVS